MPDLGVAIWRTILNIKHIKLLCFPGCVPELLLSYLSKFIEFYLCIQMLPSKMKVDLTLAGPPCILGTEWNLWIPSLCNRNVSVSCSERIWICESEDRTPTHGPPATLRQFVNQQITRRRLLCKLALWGAKHLLIQSTAICYYTDPALVVVMGSWWHSKQLVQDSQVLSTQAI